MTISEVSDMGEGNWILLRCPTGQTFGPDRDGHRFLHASEGAGSWPSPIGDGSGGGHLAPVSPGGDAVAQPDGVQPPRNPNRAIGFCFAALRVRLLDLIATVIDFCTPAKERGHPRS